MMNMAWISLFLPSDDPAAVAADLQREVTRASYTLYNAFGLLPGKAYPHTVKLFVSPAVNGWVRLIGEPDPALYAPLSQGKLCIVAQLDAATGSLEVYADGALVDAGVALAPYVRAGQSVEILQQALRGEVASITPLDTLPEPQMVAIPLDSLPPDVQAMLGNVNQGQAQQMMNQLGGNLMNRFGGQMQTDAAQNLLKQQQQIPDWNSADGVRIRATIGCLTIPDKWREPDFITLRDAYALHERRRRKPDARLYPGDAEAMQTVPDALAYTPVYGGKA
jgi:hypothetical protein